MILFRLDNTVKAKQTVINTLIPPIVVTSLTFFEDGARNE
jgi:hypothetical protein